MGVATQTFFDIALSKGAFGKVGALRRLGEPLSRAWRKPQREMVSHPTMSHAVPLSATAEPTPLVVHRAILLDTPTLLWLVSAPGEVSARAREMISDPPATSPAGCENTNGLLRDYFPKGIDLSAISPTELQRVADEINERPRKTLGGARPVDLINAAARISVSSRS